MDQRDMAGAKKARSLAELALAIQQAEQATSRMTFSEADQAEVQQLKHRLARAKQEVDELRRGGWGANARELGSKWIGLGAG